MTLIDQALKLPVLIVDLSTLEVIHNGVCLVWNLRRVIAGTTIVRGEGQTLQHRGTLVQ